MPCKVPVELNHPGTSRLHFVPTTKITFKSEAKARKKCHFGANYLENMQAVYVTLGSFWCFFLGLFVVILLAFPVGIPKNHETIERMTISAKYWNVCMKLLGYKSWFHSCTYWMLRLILYGPRMSFLILCAVTTTTTHFPSRNRITQMVIYDVVDYVKYMCFGMCCENTMTINFQPF